jgi:hypothetical protein
MQSRQDFLKKSVLASLGLFSLSSLKFGSRNDSITSDGSSIQNFNFLLNDFYPEIQSGFFNFGYAGICPTKIAGLQQDFRAIMNKQPASILEKVKIELREQNREKLSEWLGVSSKNLAFCNNSTEGLNHVIFGLPLERKSKVLLCAYDYPFARNAWSQRCKRTSIDIIEVDLSPENTDEQLISAYQTAILKNQPEILHLTHVWNWNGRILPIEQIIRFAHKKGVKVLVDGAHATGILPNEWTQYAPDFYVGTFHKWMDGGISLSFLYVKETFISELFPLNGAYDTLSSDIRKFEIFGVRDVCVEYTLSQTLSNNSRAMIEKKHAQLLACRSKISNGILSNWKTHSTGQYNGMIYLSHNVYNGRQLTEILKEKYQVEVGTVTVAEMNGIRVSPHVSTPNSRMDELIHILNTL